MIKHELIEIIQSPFKVMGFTACFERKPEFEYFMFCRIAYMFQIQSLSRSLSVLPFIKLMIWPL